MASTKQDPDNPVWSDRDFAEAKPADQVHPPEIAAHLVNKGGRPRLDPADRREAVTLRLPARVLAHFRATGPGWQTRIADVLEKEAAL